MSRAAIKVREEMAKSIMIRYSGNIADLDLDNTLTSYKDDYKRYDDNKHILLACSSELTAENIYDLLLKSDKCEDVIWSANWTE